MVTPANHGSNTVLFPAKAPGSGEKNTKPVIYLGNPAPTNASEKLDPKKVKSVPTLESKQIKAKPEPDLLGSLHEKLQFSNESDNPENIDSLHSKHINSLEKTEKKLAGLEKEKADMKKKLTDLQKNNKTLSGENEKLRDGIFSRDITITTLAFFLATALTAAAIAIPIIALVPAVGPVILIGLVALIAAPFVGIVAAGCTGGTLASISDL